MANAIRLMLDLIWYANVTVPASAVSLPEYLFPRLIEYNVRVLDDVSLHDRFHCFVFELFVGFPPAMTRS